VVRGSLRAFQESRCKQRDQLEQEQLRRMHTIAEQKRERTRLGQQAAALCANRQGPLPEAIKTCEEHITTWLSNRNT
jgi:hypothetical protein